MNNLQGFKQGLLALLCVSSLGVSCLATPGANAAGQSFSFDAIFEPSGLVHLGEGKFIVVEDEPERPFSRLELDQGGRVSESGLLEISGEAVRLNDLEGVTYDGRYLYAITSHSLTKKGKTGKDRTALIRFEYKNGRLSDARRVDDLKPVIVDRFSAALEGLSAAQINALINIEALAWSPVDQSLYIGFREPRLDGQSAIMRIHAPDGLFDQQPAAHAQLRLFWLDLQDKGIRSMNWDTTLQGFIIVAGQKKQDAGFDLWRWQATPESAASRITSIKNPLPEGTEGLATFVTKNLSGMLLVIDDGSEKKSRPAHYQLFPFELN